MPRGNSQEPLYSIVSEIERLFHQRRRENQLQRAMNRGNQNADGQNEQPVDGNAGAFERPRAIRDHLTPILDDLNPGIVAPEIQTAHFELKPIMFNMLNSIGQFGGSPHEDTRQDIRAFLEVCDSFRQQGVHEDVLKLKLFPYSLRDRARAWLSGVPAGSMESWADLCRSFLMRYNPPNMHTQLRNDIASFRQADDESMYECWDRYKGLLRKCTNHGFQDWTQVVMFYNGVNAPTRMMLDASANGTLLDKSPEEAFDILDWVANNDYQFPTTRLGAGRRAPGRLDLDANDLVSAQLSAITNMLKNLQKPTNVRDAKALNCVHCEGNHHANDFSTMHESASYVGNYNRNANNPYSNTYNPGWRQHPNFSWSNQGGGNTSNAIRKQSMNAPPGFQTNMPWQSEAKGNASTSHNNSMEAMMQEFISSTKTLLHDHSTTIKSQGNLLQTQGALLQSHGSSLRALENQVGQIAQALQVRPQGSLPSDTEVTKRNGKEQCSALTLRSGTTINKNVEPRGDENIEASPVSRQEESEVQEEAREEEGREEVLTTNPSRGQSADAAAKSVPTQETEEDIITKKRKIERYETVATAGEYFLGDIPPKKNDPGIFIIPCFIGDNYVGKALCDLGSSVNLMSKSVFMKLGMGTARPTTVILQLADRSHVRPEGKVEDLLVKVGKFVFPADFLILDCEADHKAPIILGRPFLATGRILIDCEKGGFTMRVGDQTMTINVYNTIRYMDNGEECHSLQESIATTTANDTELCYSSSIQIEDFLHLQEEDQEEADDLPFQEQQIKTVIPRSGA
ncbi:hypothetical protein V6N12_031466 [Hibiscus sabdariffa]|uniref:Retrotransposon gag domain-containing protein n=1 Tax=Hibiscus sabdariffa TaxID=183260 RepID=A0ABR2CPC1_9ROSI